MTLTQFTFCFSSHPPSYCPTSLYTLSLFCTSGLLNICFFFMHLAIQLVSAADPFYLVNTLIMGGCFYVCISPLFVLIFRSILVLPQRLIPTHTQINKLPLLNCSIDWSCSEVFLAEDLRPLCQSSRQAVNRQWLLMSPPVGKNPDLNGDQTHAPVCVNPTFWPNATCSSFWPI